MITKITEKLDYNSPTTSSHPDKSGRAPEKSEKAPKKGEFNIKVEEMSKVGLQFGHKTSKGHPKMQPYISGARNTVHLIDLEKTAAKFKEALRFIQEVIIKGGKILFVGTKIQSRELTKNTAIECDQPYVINRWLGGTFTNFEIIKKRVEYFKDLEKKKAEGELEKYTKKERARIDKEIQELETKFGGIKEMAKLPQAVFVLDMKKDETAVKEAKEKGVKVIGVSDTNCDPTLADYPIPANDDAISSIKYILEKVKEAIIKGKPEIRSPKSEKSPND